MPVWPIFDFRFWGKWPLKWKFSKMSFMIPRRDTELRFVTKFGENRQLQTCRKVLWITAQKNSGSAGFVPPLILPKMDRSRPKLPERCHPLTCLRVLNLVRIGCALQNLFRKDWFFGPKSNYRYNIGFQPTIMLRLNLTVVTQLTLLTTNYLLNGCKSVIDMWQCVDVNWQRLLYHSQ